MKLQGFLAIVASLAIFTSCTEINNFLTNPQGISQIWANSSPEPKGEKVKAGEQKNGLKAMDGSMVWTADNSFVGNSNAAKGAYSIARYEFEKEPQMPLRLSVQYKRLTNDNDRPVELYFVGGAFGVASKNYYFYESESHWTGWQAIPSKVTISDVNRLTVLQDGRNVIGYVNNVEVARFTLEKEPVGKVSLFFKGMPGNVSRVEFSDFSLATGSGVSTAAFKQQPSSSGSDDEYAQLAGQLGVALFAAWLGGAAKETVRSVNEAVTGTPYLMPGDPVTVCHSRKNFKAVVRKVKSDEVEVEVAENLDFYLLFDPLYEKTETKKGTIVDVPIKSAMPRNNSKYYCPN
ncbi:MAG: hypothetical protein LBE31_06570 [Deltaproteobacteria bacterium]|jgi:hypothetical protein|nr:hypothetical protein [Deltaproteobacteria bacterium]